ncbi:hypothetical protein [Kitasatospora arboriphila]|uniref:Uncharacterized protein n=1 Tax=Kitasatospora arboriphila TaxID=258052 RepID=A0ABP4E4P1_9ACTN
MKRPGGTWWEHRRDRELAALVDELALWGHEDLDDPGAGELAALIRRSAREAAGPHPADAVPGTAAHLELAAAAAREADAFRGSFLPQVVRNLTRARNHLRHARATRPADHQG